MALSAIARFRADEFGGIHAVGMNTTDFGRRDDHHVGLGPGQKSFSLVLPFEVDLIAAGSDHIAAAVGETAQDRGTDHAAVTRNVNPLIREIKDLGVHHIDFPPFRTLSRRGCGGSAHPGSRSNRPQPSP